MAKMTLVRNVHRDGPQKGQPKVGCTDTWTATLDGCARPGIGTTRVAAIGSLVMANMDHFGITECEDRDPASVHPVLFWRKAEAAVVSPPSPLARD